MKQSPSKQEIGISLKQYNLVVEIFRQLIKKIEDKNLHNNNWFIYSEKIGKKYLTQAYTLQQIFVDDKYIITGSKQQLFIDFSSIFSLLRVQLETYAVFFHLFAERCGGEEKIIRFRLWELDGLRSRQKYSKPNNTEIDAKLEKEKKNIETCIAAIKEISYFKNLTKTSQEYLLKNAAWRFNDNSLKNEEKNKRRLSIGQMILNTGLKKNHFDDWYSYASSHTHTTYSSVMQNDSITEDERIITEYVAIMQSTFITSFFITDLRKIYEIAEIFFNSLSENEQKVVNSFNVGGRNKGQH